MALEPQITLMAALGDLGEGIPGLDFDKIIENIVKKAEAIKAKKEAIEKEIDELRNRDRITKDEAKQMLKDKIKELIDKYKEAIKQMVIDAINEIKSVWKEIKTQVKQIPKDVKAAIAAIALPPAIGPVGPNPIYALSIAAQTKSLLVAILNALATNLIKLIKAATMISFVLPQPVLVVGETIKTLDTLLNTIPV
jgi:dsDNA-specific endonuclease/ATPase MutS2